MLIRRGVSRRKFVTASAAILAMPALLRHTRAFAADPVIRIGHVSPRTGPIAGFAEADPYILGELEKLFAGGIEANGKKVKVEIIAKDSQSNPNRAAEVASELILKENVDIITAASTPDTTNPVADQAEVNELPCITTDCPWQPYFFGRNGKPETGFDWTYHFFWGLEDVIGAFLALWDQGSTNKVVGGLFPNDADGNAWGDKVVGFPPALEKAGYKLVDPGRYQPLNNDFTSQITAFKNAGCEIVTGNMIPPDFGTFWGQAAQQGFKPKIVTIGKALLFPSVIDIDRRARRRAFLRDLVDAEPSVQVEPHRAIGEGADRRLCQGDGTAVDAADRLQARPLRGGRRRRQADRRSRRQGRHHGGDQGDRSADHRRSGEMDGTAGEKRHQDAARRRPMAEDGRPFRAGHLREQDRARDSGRRAIEADCVTRSRDVAADSSPAQRGGGPPKAVEGARLGRKHRRRCAGGAPPPPLRGPPPPLRGEESRGTVEPLP